MDILVIIWIVVFIGGRILTSIARKEQRQRYQQTPPKSRDELEVGLRPTRQKTKQTRPRQLNKTQPQRNESARLRQEMARQLKNQAERGQKFGTVKEYIDSMSGSQFEPATSSNKETRFSKREVESRAPYSTAKDLVITENLNEEIDWDNFDTDFMADSEWAEDNFEEDLIQTDRNKVASLQPNEPIAAKLANGKHKAKSLLGSDTVREAVILTEILGKPKSLRKP